MKDIVERLRGYNPPDRTNADQMQMAQDIHEAGHEIDLLRRSLAEKNEHTAQQLAACSCAALMDTPESHAKAKIERDNPFWSPAYEDVMRRTAECIKLREELAALRNSNTSGLGTAARKAP